MLFFVFLCYNQKNIIRQHHSIDLAYVFVIVSGGTQRMKKGPIEYIITGGINVLTYLALTKTSGGKIAWLSTLFIFSVSIILEAISAWKDPERNGSKFVLFCVMLLGAIGGAGFLFSLIGQSQFIEVTIQAASNNKGQDLIMGSYPDSLLFIRATIITSIIHCAGVTVSLLPFLLAARMLVKMRVRNRYSLGNGFFGK